MTQKENDNFGKKPVRRSKSEETEPAKVYRPRTLKLTSTSADEKTDEKISGSSSASEVQPTEKKVKNIRRTKNTDDTPPNPNAMSDEKYPQDKHSIAREPEKPVERERSPRKDAKLITPDYSENAFTSEDFNYTESKNTPLEKESPESTGPRKSWFKKEGGSEKPERSSFDRKEDFGSRDKSDDSRRRSSDRPSRDDRPERRSSDSDRPSFRKRDEGSDSRPRRDSDKPREWSKDKPGSDYKGRRDEGSDSRPRRDSDKPREWSKDKPGSDYKGRRDEGSDSRPRRDSDKPREWSKDKPYKSKGDEFKTRTPRKEFDETEQGGKHRDVGFRKAKGSLGRAPMIDADLKTDKDGLVRLNKYVANSGLCSRREADEYIAKGQITVNGEVVNTLGTKVKLTDEIRFKDNKLDPERKVYIILNKPKDYVTTVEDPNAKFTVMDLIEGACKERVYPVGRLDRNSTGLLLLTNDGELTTRLTHPSFEKKKIYEVGLDKNLSQADMQALTEGVVLDDGEKAAADSIAYIDESDKSEIGIEIHSGQNRVVRRMFESLGYKVNKLDRVYYAGLTKKNLPRGKWRFLDEKEIQMLTLNRFE